MGIFSFFKRSNTNKRTTPLNRWLRMGFPTDDMIINDKTALKSTAVFACVNAISSDISTLKWGVYKQEGDSREIQKDHPQHYLLSKEPYFLYTSVNFYSALIRAYLMRGNGFAEIIRNDRGRAVAYKLVDSNDVEIINENIDGRDILKYNIKSTGRVVDYLDMIHIADGVEGISRITLAAKNIEYNLRGVQHGANYMKDGVKLGGYIDLGDTDMDDEDVKAYRETFKEVYGGKPGEIAMLSGGAKFVPFNYSMTMQDAQFLESMKFSVEEIARMFRVPLHKIGMLDRSTNNNIEKQSIEYVNDCLRPIIVLMEAEFNRKVFLSNERDYYVKCNMNSLLRGDMAARAALYDVMYKTRSISPNEIRSLEEMNPREGGDKIGWDLNEVPEEILTQYYDAVMSNKQPQNN